MNSQVKNITERLKEIAGEQESLISKVAKDAKKEDLNMFLETLDTLAVADIMRRGIRQNIRLKIKNKKDKDLKSILSESEEPSIKNKKKVLASNKLKYELKPKKDEE